MKLKRKLSVNILGEQDRNRRPPRDFKEKFVSISFADTENILKLTRRVVLDRNDFTRFSRTPAKRISHAPGVSDRSCKLNDFSNTNRLLKKCDPLVGTPSPSSWRIKYYCHERVPSSRGEAINFLSFGAYHIYLKIYIVVWCLRNETKHYARIPLPVFYCVSDHRVLDILDRVRLVFFLVFLRHESTLYCCRPYVGPFGHGSRVRRARAWQNPECFAQRTVSKIILSSARLWLVSPNGSISKIQKTQNAICNTLLLDSIPRTLCNIILLCIRVYYTHTHTRTHTHTHTHSGYRFVCSCRTLRYRCNIVWRSFKLSKGCLWTLQRLLLPINIIFFIFTFFRHHFSG